ncbi:hypothetical protein [Tenacibaculum maritimum]|uniref:hypothetical protein n=1 Tax=Tenacibaculum maritimum TaxID=107401 RepID=UPI003876C920
MNYHYYNIGVKVTINEQIQFTAVDSVQIENTVTKFSDLATISLPREFKNARLKNQGLSLIKRNILDFIKPGYSIKIEAGYDGDLATEFVGYISEVGAEIPLQLKCEDEMYQLKRKPKINKTFASVSLENLIRFIAPEYEIEALQMPLGKFMIQNATPFKVIEELKSQYGIRCYFLDKKLVAGLSIDFKPGTTHTFVFGRNIRKSSSLKYVTKEQRKRFYKGISIQSRTSKKVTYEYGDKTGDHRTLHLPLNLNLEEVKNWVIKTHDNNVFSGYEGNIDSWAIPKTKAGDNAQIIDLNYPDKHRDMTLYIESVIVTIDKSEGYKRQNKLSFKIN